MKKRILAVLLLWTMGLFPQTTAFAQSPPASEQSVNTQKAIVAKKIVLSQKEAAAIDTIQIDWKKGQTTVLPSPDQSIYITERAAIMPKDTQKAGISIKDNVLLITDYTIMPDLPQTESLSKEEYEKIQEQYENTTYDLEVLLPEKQYKEFYFYTANAGCALENVSFDRITAETIYGNLYFSGVKANTLSAKTVRGNVLLHKNTLAEEYDLHSVNGNIDACFAVFPTQLQARSQYGTITLTLPENEGFFIPRKQFNGYASESVFDLKNKNDKKIYKNGEALLDVFCRNGTLILKRL